MIKTTSYIGILLIYSQNFVIFIILLDPCDIAYPTALLSEVNFYTHLHLLENEPNHPSHPENNKIQNFCSKKRTDSVVEK